MGLQGTTFGWMLGMGAAAFLMHGAAQADVLIDFAFNSLDGKFNSGTGIFEADAIDNDDVSTSGNVRRVANPSGTAVFGQGFASGGTFADAVVSLNISNVDSGAGTADGNGTLTITDVQGDTIVGQIDGIWIADGGAMFFNGLLTNVFLSNVSQDGTFDGPSGGSWSMAFSEVQPFEGAIVLLELNANGAFFDESFGNVVTDLTGQIVPAPGAAMLAGLGMLSFTAGRRRRSA